MRLPLIHWRLAALNVWLKADSGHGANPLNCWVDQSGYGNHAYFRPANGVEQPSWTGNGVNGQGAVYFAGSNAFSMPPFATNWSQAEAFVVVSSLGSSNVGAGLWLMGPGLTSFYPSTDGIIQENFGCSSSIICGVAITNLLVPRVYSLLAKSGGWTNRLNDVTQYSTTTNTALFSTDPRLGRSGSGLNFRGYISEFMVFDRELTTAERHNLTTNYLRNRYELW